MSGRPGYAEVPDHAHYHPQYSDSTVDNLTKLINKDLHLLSSTGDESLKQGIDTLISQIHKVEDKLKELTPQYPEGGKLRFEIREYHLACSHITDGIDTLIYRFGEELRSENGPEPLRQIYRARTKFSDDFYTKSDILAPESRPSSWSSFSSSPWYGTLTYGIDELFDEITDARTKLVQLNDGSETPTHGIHDKEMVRSVFHQQQEEAHIKFAGLGPENRSKALIEGIDKVLSIIDHRRRAFKKFRDYNECCYACVDAEAHLKLVSELRQLNHKVSVLKSVFPFSILESNWQNTLDDDPSKDSQPASGSVPPNVNKETITVESLTSSFRGLNERSRICLMCFLVFPEGALIKKSLLSCWAKAHGIGLLTEPIQHLIQNGLIQSKLKDTLTVSGYWMDPFVHSTLTDQKWPHSQVTKLRERIYLPDTSTSTHDDDDDIIYNDPNLLLSKKELRILHLGNWQTLSPRHIEVEDPDSFFRDMDRLSKLRYVSLRDVSRVTELPGFITKLENLEILDLKACHYLEQLPQDIGNLCYSLTHLDMSDCYLDDMPISLSKLVNLRVLKGFFVSEAKNKKNSCTLHHLLKLVNLTKLNIYTSEKSFPDYDELSILKKFKFLHSLTVSWGRCSVPRGTRKYQKEVQSTTNRGWFRKKPRSSGEGSSSSNTNEDISFNLEKLDLQCVPETVNRDWLKPINFKHLQKLYIRGGRFNDLGQVGGQPEDYQWKNVEILRLKKLENLSMDYIELKKLFPELICLERVSCPEIRNFPCSGHVWKHPTKSHSV